MRTRGGYWLSAQAIVAKRGGIHRDGGNSQGNFPISDKIGRRIGSASQAKIAKVVPSSVHADAWTRTIHRLSENWQFKNQVRASFQFPHPSQALHHLNPTSHFPNVTAPQLTPLHTKLFPPLTCTLIQTQHSKGTKNMGLISQERRNFRTHLPLLHFHYKVYLMLFFLLQDEFSYKCGFIHACMLRMLGKKLNFSDVGS